MAAGHRRVRNRDATNEFHFKTQASTAASSPRSITTKKQRWLGCVFQKDRPAQTTKKTSPPSGEGSKRIPIYPRGERGKGEGAETTLPTAANRGDPAPAVCDSAASQRQGKSIIALSFRPVGIGRSRASAKTAKARPNRRAEQGEGTRPPSANSPTRQAPRRPTSSRMDSRPGPTNRTG